MNREQLLILLDNFREASHNIQGLIDPITEAKILGNIVKIKYKFFSNKNYKDLIKLSEQCINKAKSTNTNLEQFNWYIEITSIYKELKLKLEEVETLNKENFENKCKTEHKNIFDEIKEYRKKSKIEFIEFILRKYPPKTNPLKNNQTVKSQWNKNPKSFITRLSARYNPDNYPKDTEDEKLKFAVMRAISTEINAILSEFES